VKKHEYLDELRWASDIVLDLALSCERGDVGWDEVKLKCAYLSLWFGAMAELWASDIEEEK